MHHLRKRRKKGAKGSWARMLAKPVCGHMPYSKFVGPSNMVIYESPGNRATWKSGNWPTGSGHK